MEFISKPVISCAGDEDLLPYFESHCLGTLASQQVTWKHPKLSVVHSVRLEACFTRFRVDQLQTNVKVLSSGRPIRPVGTFQPLLYIYVTSNNISHYTSHGGRSAIGSWLGHLRARNVFDWLIVMVNSDPQYNTPKILQKSNVLDKIKSDFSVRTGDRQFLEVPAPNSVEERLFNESWNQLTYLIRKAIISACMSVIVDYDVHLQMLADSCSSFTWDYFEYLDRKEELAHLYLFLGGHEHALQEYREATELLSHCIQTSVDHESKRPQWLNRLVQLSSSSDNASHYICDYSFDVTNTEIKQSSRLKDHDATLFELKNYLLSRQASILCICDRLEEFPLYTYHTICSTLSEICILDIQTEHIFLAVWILCVCLNTLTSMRLDSDRSKDDVNKSIIELLDTAFSCNNILENINFTRVSVGSLSRSSSLSSSSTHSTPLTTSSNATQCVFIDANKDSNRTIWYMSHLVDKIFTDFHCHHHYHPHHQVLRKLSHVSPIYNIRGGTPIPSESSMKHSQPHILPLMKTEKDAFWTESYAVELWLLVFNNLKQVGQLIGLWCVKSNLSIHHENHSLLNKALATGIRIQSVDYFGEDSSEYKNNPKFERQQQQPNMELKMPYEEVEGSHQDNTLLFAHNHLIPLFTSSMIYSQVFTATGQILVGFLKLMHNPKRAYEIVCDLGDYLFSQGAYESASWLYESVINYYDESSWISLVTSTRLCLAWCLHSLCIKKHFETKNDCEIARKYIQTCFTLAGTKQFILRSAADHVYGKIYFWYQTIDCIQLLSIPQYGDAINPNYWWQEAVEFRNSLLTYHQYIVLEPYNMLPLFSLKSIELEGVCNCGYQLIFAELESNSERTFKASVYITGSEPSYTDWQTLLNPNEFLPYHIMDKVNQSLVSQSDSQLHLISLTNQPTISIVKSQTTGSSNSVNNTITIANDNNNNRVVLHSHLSTLSDSDWHLDSGQHNKPYLPTTEITVSTCRSYTNIPDSTSKEQTNKSLAFSGNLLRNSGVNNHSRFDTRLGSLLNVAASLASRPAWKSQDTISVMNDEHIANSTKLPMKYKGKISRISYDGLIGPNIDNSTNMTKLYSVCPTKRRSRLSFSINGRQSLFETENIYSSSSTTTTVSTKRPLFILHQKESFVLIKPGLNRFSFIANVPGFLIPEQLFINCLKEDYKGIYTELVETLGEQSVKPKLNSDIEVNFVSEIDGDVYGPSWRDTELMKTLLPKPEIVVSNGWDKRYPVVFGTCQPIPVRLRLGKLGLSNDCKLNTSLYRIRSNKINKQDINTMKTTFMKTDNITNTSSNERDVGLNNTNGTGYTASGTYSANDYLLISHSPYESQSENISRRTHNTIENPAISSQFILEDGPAEFIREYNNPLGKIEQKLCDMDHPLPSFPPGCCLQLSRPLYLSATSCDDQFALSMPSGHYCILPVDVIKPLAFKLMIFPLPKTYIIFSLNIACVDTDPDSAVTPEIYCGPNGLSKEPITFELSNMRFYICTTKSYSSKPSLLRSFSGASHQPHHSRHLKSRSSPSIEDVCQTAEELNIHHDVLKTGPTNKLSVTVNETIESLTGDLLDNRLTKAYINHLTPFSILWRFKSVEYNNLLKNCKEFQCQPIGRFECTMNRIGDITKLNQEIRVDCIIQK
ncbi:hypothetical protein MN116_005755 [Schistosoma mekongi]|uniref:TRAPPC10/Trs130 N-terminal domain-containing protein n=1 Tax=Schistosoma mekongi TaxID=38744 RepID=A0AAE1ZAF3_SCHME|nr:hypothetical protein MN116_005755 [Schistosoma mekongi]